MYGQRLADWLVLNALHLGLVSQDDALPALENFVQYEADTAEFLEPSIMAHEKEHVSLNSEFVISLHCVYFLFSYLGNYSKSGRWRKCRRYSQCLDQHAYLSRLHSKCEGK